MQEDARSADQKLSELAIALKREFNSELARQEEWVDERCKTALESAEARVEAAVRKTDAWAEEFSTAWGRQQAQQDTRIAAMERSVALMDGRVSDYGFRIASLDQRMSGNKGVSGLVKRWPVVTSQILAGVVNVLILLNPSTWAVLPEPWPVVIPLILQVVAAVIGGQFTESKAEIEAQRQDGQLVRVLPSPIPPMSVLEAQRIARAEQQGASGLEYQRPNIPPRPNTWTSFETGRDRDPRA
jgi:hypothetical protein